MLQNGYVIAAFIVLFAYNVITWLAHRVNLYKLMGGEEHRTSIKKMIHKKKAEN